MRHINLKKIKVASSDFIIEESPTMKLWYIIKYKNGQYVDHDFVARETDAEKAGVWSPESEAQEFIDKWVNEKK